MRTCGDLNKNMCGQWVNKRNLANAWLAASSKWNVKTFETWTVSVKYHRLLFVPSLWPSQTWYIGGWNMCSSGGIIYTSRYFCTGGNEMKRTRLTCQFPTGQLWRGVDTRCVNTSHKHGRIRFSSNVFTVLSWVALVLGMTWLHQIILSK